MPSSYNAGTSKSKAADVQPFLPAELELTNGKPVFRAVTPQTNHQAQQFEDLPQFLEYAAEQRVVECSSSQATTTPLLTQEDITVWSPGELQPITGVYGSTHDHLHSREVRRQAEDMLRRAEARAQEIIAEGQRQAEEIRAEAQLKANDLYRQAYADGQAAANAEAQAMLQAARTIVDEVQTWKEAMFEQGEMMMLRLVIEIAQTIFGDGLPLDPDTLGQTFSRALNQAKSLGNLRVYVHPEDAAVLSAHWNKLQSSIGGQQIDLVPSDVIKRGGCYIDGQFGTVDARVETQFQIAKETLLTTLQRPAQGVEV
jgi:flagellar biosynthesis/type III secretory pathway protein FliH